MGDIEIPRHVYPATKANEAMAEAKEKGKALAVVYTNKGTT